MKFGHRSRARSLGLLALAVLVASVGLFPAQRVVSSWLGRLSAAASKRRLDPHVHYGNLVFEIMKAARSTSPFVVALGERKVYEATSLTTVRSLSLQAYPAEVQEYLLDSGNMSHFGNIVLGRAALQRGDINEAKERLLCAALTPGSPVLCDYGPDMTLAQELLQLGETTAVLDYLVACQKFWGVSSKNQLFDWYESVNLGVAPQFEGNSGYSKQRNATKRDRKAA